MRFYEYLKESTITAGVESFIPGFSIADVQHHKGYSTFQIVKTQDVDQNPKLGDHPESNKKKRKNKNAKSKTESK